MKLVKSLALASAASFVALSGAYAADLPGAEPVEYVKVCDAYGDGFFYIPGSNTCLQIGGFARLDYSIGEVSGTRNAAGATTAFKPANNNGFRARARVWFDARTDSEYGVVRTYIRAQFQRQSGGNNRGFGINGGSTSGLAQTDIVGDDSVFDKAFVQFAGLTAGLQDSFWDFKPYPTFTNPFISDRTLAVLGYTAEFGGGFSASVAIEDGTQRRSTFSNSLTGAGAFTPVAVGEPRYGEQKYPDFVGNLRVQGGWGEAQVSGFAHNITNEQGGAGAVSRDTAWGYGGQVGAKIKLDGIAKGDYIWGTAAYSTGSLSYLGIGAGSSDFAFGIAGTQAITASNRNFDFELDAQGNIKKTKGYAFNIGALHYWDPKWRSAIGWTYVNVDVNGVNGTIVHPGRNNDWAAWAATGNLIWSPVKKLDIGAEINYVKNTKTSAVYNLKDKDQWVGRIRVQKDF